MLNLAALFAFGNLSVLAQDETGGVPWWVILLILVIVTMVVIWALTRSTKFSEKDAPHIEHTPAEPAVEPVHAAPVVEAVRAEPAVEMVQAEPVVVIPDDLTVIEGIGPKIASVLNAAGIQTFAKLAETDPEEIRKILREADPRLARLGDPRTWPTQAKLAAAGDMSGLQALTATLKGGRQVN
jgi:predicted flap endonuclease-1-like 5' DNA nuclease